MLQIFMKNQHKIIIHSGQTFQKEDISRARLDGLPTRALLVVIGRAFWPPPKKSDRCIENLVGEGTSAQKYWKRMHVGVRCSANLTVENSRQSETLEGDGKE